MNSGHRKLNCHWEAFFGFISFLGLHARMVVYHAKYVLTIMLVSNFLVVSVIKIKFFTLTFCNLLIYHSIVYQAQYAWYNQNFM